MSLLRLYLLSGLVIHKLVWELLRRRSAASLRERGAARSGLLLVKALKIAILLGIAAQTLAPDLFPISGEPQALRIAGALLYTAGLLIAVLARLQLGPHWADIEAPQLQSTQAVVSRGFYRYVRHPIYVGDLLLLVGLELSLNSWLVLAAVAIVPVVLFQALREERMLARNLAGYDLYCERTKRFIPFVV